MSTFKEWCIKQHTDTNHMYDTLPYEFHLQGVNFTAVWYSHLVDERILADIEDATWGHDLLEDCRVTYNNLLSNGASTLTANIIYALTNEKGKTRAERANDKYYEGIRNTEGAVFVKLCDRIANITYSKNKGSRMLDMYRKENPNFISKLGYYEQHPLKQMFDHIEELLNGTV